MKNLKFALTSLFLLAFAVILVSFNYASTDDIAVTPGNVTSTADFQKLVDNDIYPFNQLSDEAVKSFKAQLVFMPNGEIGSGSMLEVKTELAIAEQELFWNKLFGGKVVFYDSMEDLEKIAQKLGVENCGVPYIKVLRNHKNAGLYSCYQKTNSFCKYCDV